MSNYPAIVGAVLLGSACALGFGAALAAATRRFGAARWATMFAAIALSAATGLLIRAIATLDFSYEYVASQSRARSGGGYRLAALWGGAEGSLLFFASLLAIVAALTTWRYRLGRWGMAVPPTITAAIAATVLFAANPFSRAPLPAVRGAGLTPILEHPAMLYHPPILYLGLVATLVPFVLVIDTPGVRRETIGSVRRWTLTAWTLLTIGLATGANWAYVELGWGGYWAWDPVENTVLMPWLVLTAAMHVVRSQALVASRPRTVAAAVATPFVLVMFGSAVTRSGGLSSVHAFADAEALGWSLGVLTATVTVLTMLRISHARRNTGVPKEGHSVVSLSSAALLAVFMAGVVLMGVAVPLLPGPNRIVTAEFYIQVGTPVLVAALFAMMAFPLLTTLHRRRLAGAFVVAAGLALVVGRFLDVDDWLRWVVLVVGLIAVLCHAVEARRLPTTTMVAHIGFAILAFGIASSAQAETVTTVLAPGESIEIGTDTTFVYESFLISDGPRRNSEAVTIQSRLVDAQGREVVRLQPALISYPDRGVVLAETALHSTPARDVQVVLRTVTDEGLGSFEISERPALMLVWWGAALIAISGLVALFVGIGSAFARKQSVER